jgi:hypothetical protein
VAGAVLSLTSCISNVGEGVGAVVTAFYRTQVSIYVVTNTRGPKGMDSS